MTEELKQTIKNGVEKLPKEIQEVVNNFDWLKVSEEIGKRNLLDEFEINILQNEIGLVLIESKRQDTRRDIGRQYLQQETYHKGRCEDADDVLWVLQPHL